MKKGIVLIAAVVITILLVSTFAFAASSKESSCEAAEQTILRLLYQPAKDAIHDYYGEPRQFWNEKLLAVRKVPSTVFYEVIMQVETFYGPHNPPYGIEAMTFYISYGQVELKEFQHQDEPS